MAHPRQRSGRLEQRRPAIFSRHRVDTSTAGFQNIGFSFDWYSTTQGIRDLQFQYNLNVSNSSGWTNFGGTSATGTYLATPNDYYNAASPGSATGPTSPTTPMISIDLSSISGANNDPNFGIRLVSAYDSTGNLTNEYASATLSSGNTVQYNGSSGNWRFDNLTFTGTAVPEPGTLALAGLAVCGAGILGWRRRRQAG